MMASRQRSGSGSRRNSGHFQAMPQDSTARKPSNASSLLPGESFQLGLEDLGSLPDPADLPTGTSAQAQLPSAFESNTGTTAELDDLFGEPSLLPDLSLDRAPSWIPAEVAPYAGQGTAVHDPSLVSQFHDTGTSAPVDQPVALGSQHRSQNFQQSYGRGQQQSQPNYANGQQFAPGSQHYSQAYAAQPQQQQAWHSQRQPAMPASQQQDQAPTIPPYGMPQQQQQQPQQQQFWYPPQPGQFMPGMDPAALQQVLHMRGLCQPLGPIPPHLLPSAGPQQQMPHFSQQQQQQPPPPASWAPVSSSFPQQYQPCSQPQQQNINNNITMGYPVGRMPEIKQEGQGGSGDTSSVNQNTGDSNEALSGPESLDTNEEGNKQGQPRRRMRNEQQKMSNRVAQRRYRLRGKHKAQELETTVAELSEQLAALQPMAEQKQALQERRAALQAQLQQSQDQLQQFRALAASQAATHAQTDKEAGSIDDLDDVPNEQQAQANAGMALQQLHQKVAQISRLAGSLAVHQQPQAERQLRQLIADYLTLSAPTTPSADAQLRQAMQGAAAPRAQSHQPAMSAEAAAQLVGRLGLSGEQKQALTAARQQHEAEMGPVREEQDRLSHALDGAMHSQEQGKDASTSEPGEAAPGFYHQANQLSRIKDACAELQGSLRQSNQLQAAFTRQAALHILSPSQAALLVASIFPAKLDLGPVCQALA